MAKKNWHIYRMQFLSVIKKNMGIHTHIHMHTHICAKIMLLASKWMQLETNYIETNLNSLSTFLHFVK